MKRYAIVAAVAILAAACGSSPSSPSNTQPNTITFSAALAPANEVPPITNADSSGRGNGTFTLNLTRDAAGVITAAKATFTYSLSGFPNGSNVILTHIHTGGPGVNGSPIVNSGLTAANAIPMPNGTLTNQTFADITVPAADAQKIIDDPNGFYFNVHTTLSPGGAARAQLVKQ